MEFIVIKKDGAPSEYLTIRAVKYCLDSGGSIKNHFDIVSLEIENGIYRMKWNEGEEEEGYIMKKVWEVFSGEIPVNAFQTREEAIEVFFTIGGFTHIAEVWKPA